MLVITSACSGGSGEPDSTSSGGSDGSQPATTNFEQLNSIRKVSGPSKELALAQFVAHFGPLAGAPGYSYDASMPVHATAAIDELLSYENELESALVDEIYQSIFSSEMTVELSSALNDKYPQSQHQLNLRQADPDLNRKVEIIAQDLAQRFGRELKSKIEVLRVSSIRQLGVSHSGPQVSAYALRYGTRKNAVQAQWIDLDEQGLDSIDSCWIVINEHAEVRFKFDDWSEREQTRTLAHEVTHCFQFEWESTRKPPQWILEGTASWVGEAYDGTIGNRDDLYDLYWDIYERPTYNLFEDFHSASIGFWSHVSNSLNDNLWATLPTIVASSSGKSETDLSMVIEQIGTQAYRDWPSSRAIKPEWGDEWHSEGVGGRSVQTIPQRFTDKTTASFGEAKLLIALPPAQSAEPLIFSVVSDGVGRMHWSNSGETIEFEGPTTKLFCLFGDCVCENGQPLDGVLDAPAGEGLVVAMTGQEDKTDSTVDFDVIAANAYCPIAPGVPEQPDIDACLVGKWDLDLEFVEAQIFVDEPGELPEASMLVGGISVDLKIDGTGTGNVDLSIVSTATEQDLSVATTLQGAIVFDWRTRDDSYIVSNQNSDVNVTASITVGGVSTPLGLSGESPIKSENLVGSGTEGNAHYICTDNTLVIMPEDPDAYDIRYLRN